MEARAERLCGARTVAPLVDLRRVAMALPTELLTRDGYFTFEGERDQWQPLWE